MRISDWSSDVCSSDLDPCRCGAPGGVDERASAADRWPLGGGRGRAPDRPGQVPPDALRDGYEREPAPGDSAGRGRPWGLSRRDRKSVVLGKRVAVRVDLGGRRIIKKKIK